MNECRFAHLLRLTSETLTWMHGSVLTGDRSMFDRLNGPATWPLLDRYRSVTRPEMRRTVGLAQADVVFRRAR